MAIAKGQVSDNSSSEQNGSSKDGRTCLDSGILKAKPQDLLLGSTDETWGKRRIKDDSMVWGLNNWMITAIFSSPRAQDRAGHGPALTGTR